MSRLLKSAELRYHRLRMRRYYRQCFNTPAGRMVLADLAEFCGANRDLFDSDARRESYRLGMRRVLLRITSWMNMSLEEIDALSVGEGEEEEMQNE